MDSADDSRKRKQHVGEPDPPSKRKRTRRVPKPKPPPKLARRLHGAALESWPSDLVFKVFLWLPYADLVYCAHAFAGAAEIARAAYSARLISRPEECPEPDLRYSWTAAVTTRPRIQAAMKAELDRELACAAAAARNDVVTLNYMAVYKKLPVNLETAHAAARNNAVEALMWMNSRFCYLKEPRLNDLDSTLQTAGAHGAINVIHYIVLRRDFFAGEQGKGYMTAAIAAAKVGKLGVLRALDGKFNYLPVLVAAAAAGKHDILREAIKIHPDLAYMFNPQVSYAAAKAGHHGIVSMLIRYARKINRTLEFLTDVLALYVIAGSYKRAEFLLGAGCVADASVVQRVVQTNKDRFQKLEWCLQHRFPFSELTLSTAMREHAMDVADWLIVNAGVRVRCAHWICALYRHPDTEWITWVAQRCPLETLTAEERTRVNQTLRSCSHRATYEPMLIALGLPANLPA